VHEHHGGGVPRNQILEMAADSVCVYDGPGVFEQLVGVYVVELIRIFLFFKFRTISWKKDANVIHQCFFSKFSSF